MNDTNMYTEQVSTQTELPPPAPTPAQPAQILPPKRSAKQFFCASNRDLVFAGILFVLCFLLTDSMFWGGVGIGMALGFVGLYAVSRLYRRSEEKRTRYAVLCGVLLIAGAVSLVFSCDGIVRFFMVLMLIVLGTVVLEERMALRTGNSLLCAVSDFFNTLVGCSVGRLDVGLRALLYETDQTGVSRKRKTGSVLIGLLIAVPILLVVIPLLASSDAAFEGLVDRLDPVTIGQTIISLLFALFLCLCLFSQLFWAAYADKRRAPVSSFAGIDPAIVGTILTALSAVYLAYLVSQFAYFFDAFRGLLPEDYTVAEYARRGFFEMCKVVALNLCLVVLTARLTAKKEGRLPGWIMALTLFLVLFSLVIVCTAFSKMVLYIQSYGMTRLRILTSVFMLFLTVVLLCVAIEQFLKKLPTLRIAVLTATLCLALLGFVNVDRVVAAYNVQAYRSGALSQLDMDTLTELNDDAVPYLIQLMDDEDLKIRYAAKKDLRRRLDSLYIIHNDETRTLLDYDFRAFTLPTWQARQLLLAVEDQLMEQGVPKL